MTPPGKAPARLIDRSSPHLSDLDEGQGQQQQQDDPDLEVRGSGVGSDVDVESKSFILHQNLKITNCTETTCFEIVIKNPAIQSEKLGRLSLPTIHNLNRMSHKHIL